MIVCLQTNECKLTIEKLSLPLQVVNRTLTTLNAGGALSSTLRAGVRNQGVIGRVHRVLIANCRWIHDVMSAWRHARWRHCFVIAASYVGGVWLRRRRLQRPRSRVPIGGAVGRRGRGYCPVTMMILMIELAVAVGRHVVVDDVTVAGYRLGCHVTIVDHTVG